jgi:hypothetical protein
MPTVLVEMEQALLNEEEEGLISVVLGVNTIEVYKKYRSTKIKAAR